MKNKKKWRMRPADSAAESGPGGKPKLGWRALGLLGLPQACVCVGLVVLGCVVGRASPSEHQ